jgi:hypothetical protein
MKPAALAVRPDSFMTSVTSRGPWPATVGEAWARRLQGARLAAGDEAPLLPGWFVRGDALGGSALFERDPGTGATRRWGEVDRHGHPHVLAAWRDFGAGSSRLAWARFRLPGGGWLELEPGSARHPLWGAADRLILPEQGVTLCRIAAQPWGALGCIPALERPAALPPGGGEAALNWLAALAEDQRRSAISYRAPYPTGHLFEALRRSFRPLEPEAQARLRFSRDALRLALAPPEVMAENPVRWAPHPWTALLPAPGVLLRHRGGIETVWIGSVPFRLDPVRPRRSRDGLVPGERRGTLAAGERLWREGPPEAPRTVAGLVLLGEPYRSFLALDSEGRVLEDRRPEEPACAPLDPDAPLDPIWCKVVLAWSAARAAAPLASAVLTLWGRLALRWAPLPLTLAASGEGGISVQAGLRDQFMRLRACRDPVALALMLVSDLAGGLMPHVLARAQAELEAGPRPTSVHMLLREGEEAQARARETLNNALPTLVHALVEGKLLDRD